MPKSTVFTVGVVVSNRPSASDPEGETIMRDLVSKAGFGHVRSIRAGKFLSVEVEARTAEEAKKKVRQMCEELRIYNPAAHRLQVGRLVP